MAKNARRKGKSGELELANLINRQLGQPCLTRNLTQTRNGGHDLIVENPNDSLEATRLDQLAIEVKRHKQTKPGDIRAWWKQAHQQATQINKVPVLFFRADREDWTAMLPLSKSLPWEQSENCISMGLPLFIEILKEPNLMDIEK